MNSNNINVVGIDVNLKTVKDRVTERLQTEKGNFQATLKLFNKMRHFENYKKIFPIYTT